MIMKFQGFNNINSSNHLSQNKINQQNNLSYNKITVMNNNQI